MRRGKTAASLSSGGMTGPSREKEVKSFVRASDTNGPLGEKAKQLTCDPALWIASTANLGIVFGIVWNMTEKPGTWGAIAAYCQALVKHYSERYDAGEEIPSFHRILTTENKWLAARHGLEAPVMDLVTGKRNRSPVTHAIRRTLKLLTPHARELGSEAELAGIEEILRRGNGADRQLRVFDANRDIVEVVRQIAAATEIAAVPA